MIQDPNAAAYKVTGAVVDEWSAKLKLLLETKHLYQNVTAEVAEAKQRLFDDVAAPLRANVDRNLEPWFARPLEGAMVRSTEYLVPGTVSTSVLKPILLVPNVKLFCKVCGSAEVYYPLWIRDAVVESKDPRGNPMPRKNACQLFFLAFQCQNCHSDPEGFIVRRSGYKLYFEGRSPIEQVVVPKYLPKKESPYFADAIIAFNSGKKLAGLFYLRTFVEQFARRITGLQGRLTGDDILDAYASTLPVEHRDHMPSFRSLYDKLSEALHEAREDDSLFESARDEIDRHFDIRRVFNITEVEHKPDSGINAGRDGPPAAEEIR